MKAVLVIDMPNDCTECPLYSDDDYGFGCGYGTKENRRQTNVDDTIPTWCPLKPLPQEGTEFDAIDTKTGKYADLGEIALKEEWAKGLVYCDMEGFAIEQDGTLILLDECGNCAYPPEGRFKLIWNIGETE